MKLEAEKYLNNVIETLKNLDMDKMVQFANLLIETYEKEKTVFLFGNGGSAATASHLCGDMVKGLSYGMEKRFKAICLSDNTSSLMAIANDISYEDVFVEQLKNFVKKDDLVIGISGSGNSMNVVKAMEYANKIGANTVALCGYDGGKIKKIAHIAIHADINDMEVSEDIHVVVAHCIKRIVAQKLNLPGCSL